MITCERIRLAAVEEPFVGLPDVEPYLPGSVYEARLDRTLTAMRGRKLDWLLLYADREHYNNFDYLTGFGPRFEEGLLLLDKNGKATILLGNECFHMYRSSRIPADGLLYQVLSLPNQPMDQYGEVNEILAGLGVKSGDRLGLVGWKLMYPVYGSPFHTDVPAFLAEGAKKLCGDQNVVNATDLFIHPDYGIRIVNNADEIALLEFGAAYASDAVQNLLLHMRTGVTEVELSREMRTGALPISCFGKVLAGDRLDLGMVSPTTNIIRFGDRFHCCWGLRGGLTCRKGFVAYSEQDLPEIARDYIPKIVAPYFAAVANWYETIGIGVSGGDMFRMMQACYPKETYGWSLNPGHYVATEEWLASPIWDGSDVVFRSGMCFQMDIGPSAPRHYASPNCEDGIVLADEALREELAAKYPAVFQRMQARRSLMCDQLNINLKPEVLPLSNITGLYRPFLLNRQYALVVK